MTTLLGVTTVILAGVLASCSSTVVDKLEAAKRGDPEDMREAITEIGQKLHAMEQSGIPYDEGALSAVEYLKEIVGQRVDPLNRAQALSALGRLKRPEVGQLYVRSLTDSFWLVRFEAVKAIYRNPRPDTARPLIKQLKTERFVEVRIELVRALIAVGTEDSLKTMLEILLDRTFRYSAMKLKAYDGVVQMSGENYALRDIESWEKFYAKRFPLAESIEPISPATPLDRSGDARTLNSALPDE
jgi:HEAT repeat protein